MISVETVSATKKFAFYGFIEGLFTTTILAVSPFPRIKNKESAVDGWLSS